MAACAAAAPISLVSSVVLTSQRPQQFSSSALHLAASRSSYGISWSASWASSAAARKSLNRSPCMAQQQKSQPEAFLCRATTYSVTLITPQGEALLNVPDDMYILDAAEDNGIELPYSCRSGACSSCAAVVKEGKVDQSNQSYLEESQVKEGFVLTCVAYPLSNIVMETHQEHGLYGGSVLSSLEVGKLNEVT